MQEPNIITHLQELGFVASSTLDDLKITHQGKEDKRYFANQAGELLGLHISGTAFNSSRFLALFPDLVKQPIQVLYLARNEFEVFIVSDYPALTFLNVSENKQLTELLIYDCPELKSIDASFCGISNVELVGDFEKLQKLDVQNCQIERFVFQADFPALRYLNLSKNKITTFHGKSKLPSLEMADFSNNRFSTLPNLKTAQNSLYALYLNDTNVEKDEIEAIRDFKALETIELKNTPFAKNYPAEVEVGWEGIKKLFEGTDADFLHAKLLLLGNPNIGKSDLLYYWKTQKHQTKPDSTHGLVYEEIDWLVENKKVCLHVWDFGGQEYFHATHKLFFSAGAINLLLWSPQNVQRPNEDDRTFELKYWLRCIEQLAQDPNKEQKAETLVIENKIDLQAYLPTALNQEKYQEEFETLALQYHSMALKPAGKHENLPRRIAGLNELLTEYLSQKQYKFSKKNYADNYAKIKKSKQIALKPTELGMDKTILEVFHNRGIVLYFPDIVPDLVFIKPQVFLTFLYTDLFGKEKKDTITKAKIEEKLKASQFNGLLNYDDLIKLLEYFDLVFQIPAEKDIFFVPQYLSKEPVWVEFFEEHHFRFSNVLIESDSFLMNLAMLKIFSEYGKSVKTDGKNYLFWQDGIVIEQEQEGKKAILLLKFDRQNQRIELYENGTNFWLLNDVINFLVAIPEKKAGLEKEIALETTNWQSQYFNIRISLDGEYYANYQDLLKTDKDYINYVPIYQKTKDDEQKKHISVYKFNKYLPKEKQGGMKKLMISYSKQDLPLIEEFKKYLEPLQRDGIIAEPWYCTLLEAGQEWDKTIQTRLATCDVVCFMCSHNSFSVDYIKEKEIKLAIERYHKDKSIMIVPIILEPFHWQSENKPAIDLGKFTALPYTAKPVTDFKNRNIAWHIISECLRVAILNKEKDPDFDVVEDDFWTNNENKNKLPKDIIGYFERMMKHSLDA